MNRMYLVVMLSGALVGCVGLAFDQPFVPEHEARPWGESFRAAGNRGDWRDQFGR